MDNVCPGSRNERESAIWFILRFRLKCLIHVIHAESLYYKVEKKKQLKLENMKLLRIRVMIASVG